VGAVTPSTLPARCPLQPGKLPWLSPGDGRGQARITYELPEELRTPEGRRQALAEAKRRLEERKGRPIKEYATADPEMDLGPLVLGREVLRRGGRREWPRVARRELEAHRAQQAQPIPRGSQRPAVGGRAPHDGPTVVHRHCTVNNPTAG
jgi:5-formyltetrahydrofolate cyclo-ligase